MTQAIPPPVTVLVVGATHGALLGPHDDLAAPAAQVLDRAAHLATAESPRWVVWSASRDLGALAQRGVPLGRAWDLAEVHRLIHGGWRADPTTVWAGAAGLDLDAIPAQARGDLFDAVDDTDPEHLLRSDGYLHPDRDGPAWVSSPGRARASASAARAVFDRQWTALSALGGTAGPRAIHTAYAESAAALLCLELERDGLPIDRAAAEELIGRAAGPRPRSDTDAARIRGERDRRVLDLLPGGGTVDLRNPAQVKELLTSVGVEVPHTRAWVLEPYRQSSPVVAALLDWRKDERIATTYGYRWLDEHVGPDDRLRGAWTACDGGAGRMTAQSGLHNLPAPLRHAVRAEPGWVFVRADLGQIEPRVLAAVSGDQAFAEATRADDLYAPVAAKLGVDRAVAKVAVLAAMYGQRSGAAGEALADLVRAYPVAMRFLDDAYDAGVARRPLRTYGGRFLPLGAGPATLGPEDSGRGRYARNAVVQGAAAELFKAWVATIRHTLLDGETALGRDGEPRRAQVSLCLHDEVLIHSPHEQAPGIERLLHTALDESARRWTGTQAVRFVADTTIVRRWSEAK
ncbi:MAG TPA: DNA polymerase [Candidatus Lustribacter sp.]|nr:DNA polymerase [Candidatus Lustribacter sp.]